MRGKPQAQPDFLTVINLNQSVPANHPLRRSRYRGLERTQAWGYFVAGTYNLVRLAKLGATA